MTLGSLQEPWPRKPTERQEKHVAVLREAIAMLRQVMHEAEGSQDPGQHQEHVWSTRRMAAAATHLEIAEMFAVKAALEN
jgi:hypothetical protein